jgi:large subunit ribosomal protein L28
MCRLVLAGGVSPRPPARCRLARASLCWYKARLVFGVPQQGRGPRLEDSAMSKVCQITGKGPTTGNTVSHANNRKRRRFLPNLHKQRFWLESEKRWVRLKVSGHGLRTIEKKGIETVIAELRAQGVKV